MKKFYDKLIFLLALLALAAGCAVYFMQSAPAPVTSASMGDHPYEAVPVPDSSASDAHWPMAEAPADAPDELFDVFTPPKIWLDTETLEFVFQAPYVDRRGDKPIPFGVEFVDFAQVPFRLQLQGYVEEDPSDATKSLLLFGDAEKGERVRARVGDEKTEYGFKVVDFEVKKVVAADNSITREAKATILDLQTNQEVVLVPGEILMTDEYTVTLQATDVPDLKFEFSQAPESFEIAGSQYVLEEINLEEPSVSVKKQGDGENEAVTKKLTLSKKTNTNTVKPVAPSPAPAIDSGSDLFGF
ncbi:hypothetical protein [Coraliomargarita parva]|uniref:hypothetical protein n=1 Tax=Coraliomargarita parva TaxID=3014050 RepID=UPI0022B584C9|nr:hypothetical protein [Coraliomargarita parva]